MDKQHGYDNRISSFIQLKNVLKIPDKQYLEVKDTIKSLTLTTLDICLQGQQQTNGLLKVEENLQKTFPEVFNTQQKLAFAKKVALQFHRRARRTTSSRRLISSRGDVNQEVVPKTAADPPELVQGAAVSSHRTAARVSQASSTVTRTSCAAVSTVHQFLRNCDPSMERLLYRFVEMGFQSLEDLQAVANSWTTDERRDLLKRLPPSNGKGITELELAALERGFCAFHSD